MLTQAEQDALTILRNAKAQGRFKPVIRKPKPGVKITGFKGWLIVIAAIWLTLSVGMIAGYTATADAPEVVTKTVTQIETEYVERPIDVMVEKHYLTQGCVTGWFGALTILDEGFNSDVAQVIDPNIVSTLCISEVNTAYQQGIYVRFP